ncbi:MAG: deoxyribose-phosphate aldolase [Aestuariibacter sp.]
MIDLTSLNGNETEDDIVKLCESSGSCYGSTAAVCVYPQFVRLAKSHLTKIGKSNIAVATVVNFPSGQEPIEKIIKDTELAIAHGADEIDIVLPYQSLLAGDVQQAEMILKACKNVCANNAVLKVIIESGVLESAEHIRRACEVCFSVGVEFIKTSTGKVKVNATPSAALEILQSIKASGTNTGIKVSGGVKNLDEAAEYLSLAQQVMGDSWIDSRHFRFGASSLLSTVIDYLQQHSRTDNQAVT